MSRGGLLIWNGCRPERMAEYERWYQEEHLPERVGIPGFLSGSRYEALEAQEPRFFTYYETCSPEVLLSPRYRALLADPSPRTRAIMPAFTGMSRTVCRKRASWGIAATGSLVCLTGQEPDALAAIARDRQGGACLGWSLWQAVPEPGRETEEMALRGGPDATVEACLLLTMARREEALEMTAALRNTAQAAAYSLLSRTESQEARQ